MPEVPSPLAPPQERWLTVSRSARYYVLGEPSQNVRDVWIVLHGYGQLAGSFITEFEIVRGGERLVVAPEALSRFYVDAPVAGSHANTPVGATWMTREAREKEIQDYVSYLDAVCNEIFSKKVQRSNVRLRLLGFSQGVATAARWTVLSALAIDEVIFWGGLLPADADLVRHRSRLSAMTIRCVNGATDSVIPEAAFRDQSERLRQNGLAVESLQFQGGHRLDRGTLFHIATTPEIKV